MAKEQKISGEERVIDLLERIGATFLYVSTDMGQTDIAKILGIDNNRANKMLKGVKKQKQHAKKEK